jgi:sugar phosphate isomerase/epimerase
MSPSGIVRETRLAGGARLAGNCESIRISEGDLMTTLSRRDFIRTAGAHAAAAGAIAGGAVRLRANPLGLPIGSQTWPHRAMIKDGNFAGLAKTLADIGVQTVEMCSPFSYEEFASLSDGKQVRKVLADHGLSCESCHFGMEDFRERHQQCIAWAKDVGITQMLTATLAAGEHPTMDVVKKAADEYNGIAAVTAKAGLQQGLHNEGFELSEVDGRRTYDVLFELLDPKLVKFQFQMSTIAQGFVAADYFTKYPGRFISMHLQDVDLKGAPSGARGRVTQVPLGKGSIDWTKTFQAAKVGGVKNYFVEQNMELTKESVAYLKSLTV